MFPDCSVVLCRSPWPVSRASLLPVFAYSAWSFKAGGPRAREFSLPNGVLSSKVGYMENHHDSLDAAFHALSDPTRRAVLRRLTRGPAPVKELAEPFDMGLSSFLKHLRVLEDDGMIQSQKVGRVRTCRMNAERLALAESWLSEQRAIWQARTDRLADYAETQLSKSEDHED